MRVNDEVQRSLAQVYLALDDLAQGLRWLADVAANPQLDYDTRRMMAEAVHRLADRIEELD